MEDDLDIEDDNASGGQPLSEDAADKKARPPNKKKYDEDMLALSNQIREKETEYERVRPSGITKELKSLRDDKFAKITRRKEIDAQLDKINKEIPQKMKHLNQLEMALYYKSEDKINNAIHRLEWNLTVQSFKLSEEKKIVSEIDGLKRSKKTLVQYTALKQEIGVIRDQQKRMRDERDFLFRAVSQLKSNEEKLKTDASMAKSTSYHLKKEIDSLYERKRTMSASFKRQKEEYNGAKEKHRKEGLKRKESLLVDKRKRIAEKEAAKVPYEEEIHLCNTLIAYLNRHSIQHASGESSLDSQEFPPEEPEEPAEEIDDGQFVLLKKSEDKDSVDYSGGARKLSRRNRRSRKQSVVKQMTHAPETLSQFMSLGLVAPASTADISDALEKLVSLKARFESEIPASPLTVSEVASDAGISATESLICEMSRQVSKTESSEGGVAGAGSGVDNDGDGSGKDGCSTADEEDVTDRIYADLLRCQRDSEKAAASGLRRVSDVETGGAVGGVASVVAWDSQEGSGGQSSDSTLEGDTGSVESQPSLNVSSGPAVTSVSSVGGHVLPELSRSGRPDNSAHRQASDSSDSVSGACGGKDFGDVPYLNDDNMDNTNITSSLQEQNQERKVRPTLLYSEMLNKAAPPAAKRQHAPLSASMSSPASFFKVESSFSSQQLSPRGGAQSYSLDSGTSQKKSPQGKSNVGGGSEWQVVHHNKEKGAIQRRSTFSGQERKRQNRGKTATERRETFSHGHRRERQYGQQRLSQSSLSSSQGSIGSRKSLASSPASGADISPSSSRGGYSRPRAITVSGGHQSMGLPPLSASWSGVASGALRNVSGGRSPNSSLSPGSGKGLASYSSVASPVLPSNSSVSSSSPSPAKSSEGQRHHNMQPSTSQHSQLSERPRQHQSSISMPTDLTRQRTQPALLSPIPQSPASAPLTAPLLMREPAQGGDKSKTTSTAQVEKVTGLLSLASLEEEFPPLSLSASLPNPPRRNSATSNQSARSNNSAGANTSSSGPQLSPHSKSGYGHDHICSPSQQQQQQCTLSNNPSDSAYIKSSPTIRNNNNNNVNSHNNAKSVTNTDLRLAIAAQPHTSMTLFAGEGLLPQFSSEASGALTHPGTKPFVSEEYRGPVVSTVEEGDMPLVLPTDKSFTERWVESSRAYTGDSAPTLGSDDRPSTLGEEVYSENTKL